MGDTDGADPQAPADTNPTQIQADIGDLADFRTFVGAVVLRHPLAMLPENLRGPWLDAITARAAPKYSLDYVRLELRAGRPAK